MVGWGSAGVGNIGEQYGWLGFLERSSFILGRIERFLHFSVSHF